MVEDLREMQKKQRFSENRIDKPEFIALLSVYKSVPKPQVS